MLTTEQFFEYAEAAGMTVPASWAPSGGGATQTADVIFKAPSHDVLAGGAFATDPSIQYAAVDLVGLKRGETVTVNGSTYKVREDPQSELDGTRMKVPLTRS